MTVQGTSSAAPAPSEQAPTTVTDSSRMDSVTPEEGFYEGYSLFEDEVAPTEAELMGEPVAGDATQEGEAAKQGDDSTAKGDKGQEKPQEGFVPHGALHEERLKRQDLAAKLSEAEKTIESLTAKLSSSESIQEDSGAGEAPVLPEHLKDFKVLTYSERRALIEDDPIKAMQYNTDLDEYNRYQEDIKAFNANTGSATAGATALIERANRKLLESIPDFYEEKSASRAALTEFAREVGFSSKELFALTDPETKIVIPGTKRAIPLGEAATDLILVLHNMRGKINSSVKTAEEKTAATVMSKVRGDNTETIGEAPGEGKQGQQKSIQSMSEEEYASLPPEEREKMLMGL